MARVSNTTTFILNYAPHYRAAIFKKILQEIPGRIVVGDVLEGNIKSIDFTAFPQIKVVKNRWILSRRAIWQAGAIRYVLSSKNIVLTGDPGIFSNWVIAIIGRATGKNVLFWAHGLKQRMTGKGRLFTYSFFKLATGFLLYSEFSKNVMLREGFAERRLHCIYNSLDYDLSLALRTQCKPTNIYTNVFGNSDPVIIYTGRVTKDKKVDMLIAGLSLLREKGVKCNLVVVGDVTDGAISEIAKKNGNIWFRGAVYDEATLATLIYNADVCVSPGSIGLTAIHSLSYGTPVITHNNFAEQGPEFEAITPGETGDYFAENDVSDMCLMIKKWLGLPKGQRDVVRQKAYATIDSRYSTNAQIALLKNILSDEHTLDS